MESETWYVDVWILRVIVFMIKMICLTSYQKNSISGTEVEKNVKLQNVKESYLNASYYINLI